MSENADNAYGYNEFINRLRKARTDKEECKQREEETFSQGKKWTGQATTPREFNLGTSVSSRQGREQIRSLGKVGPPEHFLAVNNYPSPEDKEPSHDDLNSYVTPFAYPQSTTVNAHSTYDQNMPPTDVSNFLASQHASVMAMVRHP
eukprot:TRINITY_DN13767_c0_g1_i1.p1 TRINITY_DN13767_c0_g1~~TRINITY_DN13767_c0_g1_i1.p1  ORF type:complete len:147 (+),score=10.95 TRINITY_DN13767_c0_g1_i1:42-482(+)